MKYNRRQFVSASALALAAGATARATVAEAPQPGFAEILQRAGIREAADLPVIRCLPPREQAHELIDSAAK